MRENDSKECGFVNLFLIIPVHMRVFFQNYRLFVHYMLTYIE